MILLALVAIPGDLLRAGRLLVLLALKLALPVLVLKLTLLPLGILPRSLQ